MREHWLYDPWGGLRRPQLQGFVLAGSRYRPLPARSLPDGSLPISSWLVGLELLYEEGRLRLLDPKSGQYLLTASELRAERAVREFRASTAAYRAQAEAEARRSAEQWAQTEVRARQAAEARSAELEAALQEFQQSCSPSA